MVPSALPLIFAGLRISLGVGWMVLIALHRSVSYSRIAAGEAQVA